MSQPPHSPAAAEPEPPEEPFGDLPPALIALMRQIARDCRFPGRYQVTIEIPASPRGPRTAVISRLELVRVLKME